ncbi:MAG: hypothetical protein J2P58_15380, partial [Acidimicrobiaceae bacterium]|nr:hypothetical protein [Acidimicrobiaceae bacterium]
MKPEFGEAGTITGRLATIASGEVDGRLPTLAALQSAWASVTVWGVAMGTFVPDPGVLLFGTVSWDEGAVVADEGAVVADEGAVVADEGAVVAGEAVVGAAPARVIAARAASPADRML